MRARPGAPMDDDWHALMCCTKGYGWMGASYVHVELDGPLHGVLALGGLDCRAVPERLLDLLPEDAAEHFDRVVRVEELGRLLRRVLHLQLGGVRGAVGLVHALVQQPL